MLRIARPPFQRGLLEGRRLWELRYADRMWAIDTLCTHSESKLFAANGWQLVGRTEGYASDPASVFSNRAFAKDWRVIVNNVALKRVRGGVRWWVWVCKLGHMRA